MGGAFLTFKAWTRKELDRQVSETIRQAERMGLSDVRDFELFAPGKFIKPDGKTEDQWVALLSVHS